VKKESNGQLNTNCEKRWVEANGMSCLAKISLTESA